MAHCPGAVAVEEGERCRAIADLEGARQAFAESSPGCAADQHEAPGPQAAVIRRTEASLKDQVEFGSVRRWLGECAHGPAGQQKIQSVQAIALLGYGCGKGIPRDTDVAHRGLRSSE